MKMKTKTYTLLFMLGALCSCNDDFLDRAPQDQLTDANFWQNEQHLQSVANTFTESLQGKYWLGYSASAKGRTWAITVFRPRSLQLAIISSAPARKASDWVCRLPAVWWNC